MKQESRGALSCNRKHEKKNGIYSQIYNSFQNVNWTLTTRKWRQVKHTEEEAVLKREMFTG